MTFIFRGLACAWLLFLSGHAAALDPARGVAQFHHTAWTVNQGAPGQVTALAQTADGYLWLGTEIGLYRFDGARFTRFVPPGSHAFPATSVSTLYTSRSGGLWVGFRYGGVSLIEGSRVRHYGPADGLPTSTVFRFAEDGDGRLWAATFTGPVALHGQHWARPTPAMAYPGRQARTLFTDRDGTLWVATENGLVVLRRGARAFASVPGSVGRISQIAQAPDGALWVAEADGGVRALREKGEPGASAGLLFDRDGVLWATTLGTGLLRRSPQRSAAGFESFRRVDGLSSDYLQPLLEDREGNLWVGSSRGLDRFRHANLIPVAMPEGAQEFAIAADGDALLVGTRNHPLQHVDMASRQALALSSAITAMHRDAGGRTWLAGPEGVWRKAGARFDKVSDLPVSARSGVQAMATTPDGALWLSLNTPGLHRFQEGRWTHLHDQDGLPSGDSPLVMQADAHGRLWLGFARNAVAVMENGRFSTPWSGEALDVGNVTALFEDSRGMWIGGERGLAQVAGGRLRNVVAAVREDLRGISGIVADDAGDLWFNGARGVVRVRAADIASLFGGRGRPRYERFDALDALPGIAAQFRPLPTAARTQDGRLWFATTSGLVSIDPRQIVRNPVAPPVEILSLAVDGAPVPLNGGEVRLPAGTRNLGIRFTALSLSIPERVRFRYRLDGFDSQWLEASPARSAFYNAPGSGRYVFRVAASNNDGVWNEQGARLVVSIAPHYWETGWFRVLCVVAAVALLWLLYLARLRQVAAHIRGRLDERHRERERIARDLHDTLLQSTQGLILRLHASSRKLDPADPVRLELDAAMTMAERVAADGRERVRGLRGDVEHARDLGAALMGVLEETHGLETPAVRLVVEGTPRPMQRCAAEEAYMIGREAMLNAFRHAHATSVEVSISYGRHAFRLRIHDDGRGFSQDAEALEGHWGLEGMRERAARAGGTLTILSGRPGRGTEIDLQIPAALAWQSAFRPGFAGLRDRARAVFKRVRR
ncbi:two-component regulator propeller domain-containing protein [Stenotrophomonas sp.]|uniref:sensor histidine kinase n=1 Tax=Stenotrophomonas sp. TaxID=69392 RepID=UPI0028B1CB3E|nr:two-component regulator propeller domain-containing protein [Stenotrophomonas sp.]